MEGIIIRLALGAKESDLRAISDDQTKATPAAASSFCSPLVRLAHRRPTRLNLLVGGAKITNLYDRKEVLRLVRMGSGFLSGSSDIDAESLGKAARSGCKHPAPLQFDSGTPV